MKKEPIFEKNMSENFKNQLKTVVNLNLQKNFELNLGARLNPDKTIGFSVKFKRPNSNPYNSFEDTCTPRSNKPGIQNLAPYSKSKNNSFRPTMKVIRSSDKKIDRPNFSLKNLNTKEICKSGPEVWKHKPKTFKKGIWTPRTENIKSERH